MAEGVKQVLQRPIQLADEILKLAKTEPPSSSSSSSSSKTDLVDLRAKTEKLLLLLRQAARADLVERPTRRIIHETEQVLEKTLAVVSKSRANLLKRVFQPAPPSKKIHSQLENSISDLSWLLRVSDDDDDAYLSLPPIASSEPILGFVWGHVARLHHGSLDGRAAAALSLASLAADNDRKWKLIVEEGAVFPLLKLIKEGKAEAQETAVRAVRLLARDAETGELLVQAGVCGIFAKILKDGVMRVQAEVAWAIAELAAIFPPCQDDFAGAGVVRSLVTHLAFETVQEHSKYAVSSSIHSVVLASGKSQLPGAPASAPGVVLKGREAEDPETKAKMKAMAAKALAMLARGNPDICKSITDSKALLCFATLLEKGHDEVQLNSAVALCEIAGMAETDAELRRSAFNPSAPAARAVVDQLLKVVESSESVAESLLRPCVRAIGCLSRTFRAKETRIIGPLVRLLDNERLTREAVAALTKFACDENYLHVDHARAIAQAQAAKPLVQLVYLGEPPSVKKEALVLLCYVARHVPENEALTEDDNVISALRWASKNIFAEEEEPLDKLLTEAKSRLELYQSREPRGGPLVSL